MEDERQAMSRQPEKPSPGKGKADEAFLSRWSRLKVDEGANNAVVAADLETAPPEGSGEGGQLTEEEIVASLPDIESLEEVSDFTPFLREGVPELLKRQALRRLWRVNPVFAEIDGLAEYAEDYTDATSMLVEVKTAYKVGRGYLDQDAKDEAPEETLAETDIGEASDVAGEAAPESEAGSQPETTPPLVESEGPQADLAEAKPEADSERVSEPRTAVAPRAEMGRAAARRWGLPES